MWYILIFSTREEVRMQNDKDERVVPLDTLTVSS